MHELSIADAIVRTATGHAGGRPVAAVGVRVGRMRQVVPDSLRFYWGVVTKGTTCERAGLRLEEIEAELTCADCGNRWEPDLPRFRCERCGSANVEVSGGAELSVEYIEIEDEEATCIAHE